MPRAVFETPATRPAGSSSLILGLRAASVECRVPGCSTVVLDYVGTNKLESRDHFDREARWMTGPGGDLDCLTSDELCMYLHQTSWVVLETIDSCQDNPRSRQVAPPLPLSWTAASVARQRRVRDALAWKHGLPYDPPLALVAQYDGPEFNAQFHAHIARCTASNDVRIFQYREIMARVCDIVISIVADWSVDFDREGFAALCLAALLHALSFALDCHRIRGHFRVSPVMSSLLVSANADTELVATVRTRMWQHLGFQEASSTRDTLVALLPPAATGGQLTADPGLAPLVDASPARDLWIRVICALARHKHDRDVAAEAWLWRDDNHVTTPLDYGPLLIPSALKSPQPPPPLKDDIGSWIERDPDTALHCLLFDCATWYTSPLTVPTVLPGYHRVWRRALAFCLSTLQGKAALVLRSLEVAYYGKN